MGEIMAYKYDVFLSYTRAYPFGDWIHEHFFPLFAPYLSNALNRPATVFVDSPGISTGDTWPERLKNALACSKCLIEAWSPSYFYSGWCMYECAIMFHREQQLGYRTINNPSGLVLPINVFDGEHFPPFAKQIQYLDCRRFVRPGSGFTKTERYVEFQDIMITWIDEVARAVNNAPAWMPEWLTKAWLDDIIKTLPHREQPTAQAPLGSIR
jgi:TIR domain